ncbi:hypothetical protein TNCV_1673241 [Trichonephila clavipes]|nr:hypothetical protein TNCV_1673241 [Trichonephila clavipes]
MKKFDQTPYKLPPPTPIYVPAEKRPLEEKSLPFSKKRVRITPVMRRVSRRPELLMAPVQIPYVLEPVQIPLVPQPPVQIPDVPEPVQIPHVPESPVQIPVSQVPQSPVQTPEPVQILHVPETMQILPELDTLDPLESTDAFDQLMSFVFGPPAQELQLLHTVPSIFDGDLISFLDELEKELAPMDLTMPRLNPCVKKSIGFKAIQPMDLSVNSCL